MSTCDCCVYTLNFLAIFSFVSSAAEPLNKTMTQTQWIQYMLRSGIMPGLLVGLLGIVVDTLGEVALSPEPTPLVHPV